MGRGSNTPSKFPSSFALNPGSGKVKENGMGAPSKPFAASAKPFSIPLSTP